MARPIATLCVLALLAAASANENPRLDLLRRLAEGHWPGKWDATPRIHQDLSTDSRYANPESRYTSPDRYIVAPNHDSRTNGPFGSDNRFFAPSENVGTPDNQFPGSPDNRFAGSPNNRFFATTGNRFLETPDDRFLETSDDRFLGSPDNRFLGTPVQKRLAEDENSDEYDKSLSDETFRDPSEKRSAVATALNAGRRRRQPAPALGKAVTPYVGVGVLNDVGSFFDSLRDNLETLASLSPQERATLFHDPPTVVHAPAHGGSGGGVGFRKLHALRPLRPTGNIRSYNRRSLVEGGGAYPGANQHDPGLLWTGLGR